jgi:hypothetical protein
MRSLLTVGFCLSATPALAQSDDVPSDAAQPVAASEESAQPSTASEENDQPSNSGNMITYALSTSVETTKEAVTRPWQYIGFDIGPATLKTDEVGEVDKQGMFFSLKTRLLFDFQAFTVEGAAGLFQANVSGDTASGKHEAAVTTTMLEAGGKWGVTDDIEVGGFALWAFGEASDFGPVKEANTNNLFVGIQAAFDPNWFDIARGRLLLTYLFDKTIVTRNFSSFTIGYEMGLPWLDNDGNWMWDQK